MDLNIDNLCHFIENSTPEIRNYKNQKVLFG